MYSDTRVTKKKLKRHHYRGPHVTRRIITFACSYFYTVLYYIIEQPPPLRIANFFGISSEYRAAPPDSSRPPDKSRFRDESKLCSWSSTKCDCSSALHFARLTLPRGVMTEKHALLSYRVVLPFVVHHSPSTLSTRLLHLVAATGAYITF